MKKEKGTFMTRVSLSTSTIRARVASEPAVALAAANHARSAGISASAPSSPAGGRRGRLSRIAGVCVACTLTSAMAVAQPSTQPRSTADDVATAPDVERAVAASAPYIAPQFGTLSLPRVLPLTVQQRPGVWHDLFAGTWSDAKRLPSKPTLEWLAIGALAAGVSRPADSHVGRSLASSSQLHEVTESGAYIGSTPIQLGLGAATYFIGRAKQSSRLTTVGAQLFRAELLSEGLTFGIKQSVRRNRPEGSGFAFPSGHTTVSFASATVLQQNYGWRVGAPAYALASFVALSRVQMKRHYLSDVAFGAALGIAAGRTVAFGPSRRIVMTPTVVDGGGGVQFVWKK